MGVNGMPGNSGDTRLNHNQSRRDCDGFAGTLANNIRGAISGTFTAPPADYAMAQPTCDVINSHAFTLGSDSANNSWTAKTYGCSATQKADTTQVWRDCLVGYGSSDGLSVPTDYSNSAVAYSQSGNYQHTITISSPSSSAGTYGRTSSSSTTACDDASLGDGKCDLCLLAKYGYDAAPGQTADDDCVTAPAGSSNLCYDVMPAYENGSTTPAFQYYQGYRTYHCNSTQDCLTQGLPSNATCDTGSTSPTKGFCFWQ